MKKPLVYVIILNWNGYKDTIPCIESVKKSDYKHFKILVVDNASTNESVKKIHAKFPRLMVLQNKKNFGYSEGNNIGIRYALKNKADYVLILNNDTLVDKKAISSLVTTAQSTPAAGIVSPLIYYAGNRKLIWSAGGSINYRSLIPFKDFGYQQQDFKPFSTVTEVDFVTGCCVLIKRDVFRKAGMMDKEYFLYIEFIDFCVQTVKANYKILIDPKAIIWHKVASSSEGEGNTHTSYYVYRNLILFAKKNLKTTIRLPYYLNALLVGTHEALRFVLNKKNANAGAVMRGISDGFRGKKGQTFNK